MTTRRKTWTARALIATTLAAGIGLAGSASANAAPPPAGYKTSQVLATAANPSLGNISLRRGFWDADTDLGWGVDKAWNKHNVWSVEAQRRVMMSTNYTKQGNGRYALVAYAGKYKCGSVTCTLIDQRKLIGLYNPFTSTNYHGWPVNGVMGLQTLYCDQGGAAKCPNWVTYSILNPGVNNPYSSKTSTQSVPTDGSTPSPLEQGLTPQQKSSQSSILQSQEIQSLQAGIAAGTAQSQFSYQPLPKTIPAK